MRARRRARARRSWSTFAIKADDGRFYDDTASRWVRRRTQNCLWGTAAAVADMWAFLVDEHGIDCRIVRVSRA